MADRKIKARIIICGGRHFNDYEALESSVTSALTEKGLASNEVEIVSGHCEGADTLGELYANKHDIACKVFPAEWTKYGKAAGPIRNRAMLDYAKEQTPVVAAFWNGESRGTGNMIKQAKTAGVECHIFLHEPNKSV